jgi:hypothetical protein
VASGWCLGDHPWVSISLWRRACAGRNDVTSLNSSADGILGAPYRPFPNRVTRVENEIFCFKRISRKRRAYEVGEEREGIARTLREF